MLRRRVVITGLGAVCSLGNDVPTVWEAAKAGRSGARRVTRFDPSAIVSSDGQPVLVGKANLGYRLDLRPHKRAAGEVGKVRPPIFFCASCERKLRFGVFSAHSTMCAATMCAEQAENRD